MASTYKVIDQSPATVAMPGGQYEPAVNVTFSTIPSGIIDTVKVPKSRYTPEYVDQVIAAATKVHEAVRNL